MLQEELRLDVLESKIAETRSELRIAKRDKQNAMVRKNGLAEYRRLEKAIPKLEGAIDDSC